jgi:hypothetical protein
MSEAAIQTRLAKVVHVIDPDMAYARIEVVINRGAADGVKSGDRLLVFGERPMISDPDTGKELGQLELVRGRGEVVHVQEHLATIRSIERRRERPAKRVFHEASRGIRVGLINSPDPRIGTVIEEELAPEVTVHFDHVRLGDQAKPI